MNRSNLFSNRGGFTLIEMLISISIFTIMIVAFVGIFVAITNIGTQQSSSSAVNQESQALLQKIQYYVETASLINIATSTPTSTLQLFMASSSADPTYITLASGTVYLQQSTSSPLTALTSGRVTVSSLSFTRQSNPPGHDVVNVSFTMAYNTSNIAQSFSQLFQSSVVHVSAATFDTGVYPSTNPLPLGTSGGLWSPINGVIYTSGNDIGIGQGSPQEALDIAGGVRLDPQTTVSSSTCNSATRGTLIVQSGNTGMDLLYACLQNASGTPTWWLVN